MRPTERTGAALKASLAALPASCSTYSRSLVNLPFQIPTEDDTPISARWLPQPLKRLTRE
jgi:hypothetical protein